MRLLHKAMAREFGHILFGIKCTASCYQGSAGIIDRFNNSSVSIDEIARKLVADKVMNAKRSIALLGSFLVSPYSKKYQYC